MYASACSTYFDRCGTPDREARMFRNLLRGQILIWFVYSTVIASTAVAVIRP